MYLQLALAHLLWQALLAKLVAQLRAQLWAQLPAQLWAQLRAQLRAQLWAQLRAQLWAQLWAQVKLPEQLALTVQSLTAELFPLRVPGHDFPQRLSNSLTTLPKVA